MIPWRRDRLLAPVFLGFSGSSDSKEFSCNAGEPSSIPGLGRSPGGAHDNPSRILAWRILKDRGAWRATAHGVTKSQTQMSDTADSMACSGRPRTWSYAVCTFRCDVVFSHSSVPLPNPPQFLRPRRELDPSSLVVFRTRHHIRAKDKEGKPWLFHIKTDFWKLLREIPVQMLKPQERPFSICRVSAMND